jgi:hypothetical protein
MLLVFGVSLGYIIRKIQENYGGLEMNGTHQLLIYGNDDDDDDDDDDLLSENINTIKKNTEIMLDASKYMQKSFHQNA